MKKYLVSVLALVLFGLCQAQMINGGKPIRTHAYSIEHAVGWYNLNNTCDLAHPNTSSTAITPNPHTGIGNARFGVPFNG